MYHGNLSMLGAVLAVGLSAAPAAWAQSLSTKDAWEALNAFVNGTGLEMRSEGLVRDGDALIAQRVALQSGPAPAAFAMTFETIRIQPDGAGFAIIPSANFDLSTSASSLSETRSYSFTHDGRMIFTPTDQDLSLTLDFPTLTVQQTGATRNGRPLDETLQATFTTLGGRFGLALASPFALTGLLEAARLDYTLNMTDNEFMTIRQSGTSSSENLRVTLEATGLDQFDDSAPGYFRRAFEAGFSARLQLTSGVSSSDLDQTIGETSFAMQATVADSNLVVGLANGRFEFDTGMNGFQVQAQSQGISGQGTIASLNMAAGLPIVSTPEDTEFTARLAFGDLALDPALLGMIGMSSFAGETANFDLNLSGLGRWLVEITDNPEPADMPVTFTSVRLNNFLAQIGQAMLSGNGTFAFTPGTFGRGDVPDGTGDFVFELVGGEATLNRLVAAGLLPPDQQFMTRMMMNAVGRQVGADHLRSEIAIRPGNVITVNGLPLPF